ncbi:Protein-glutamate methylesterase/protein-glutamine glutaminase [Anaerolineae bacterium]|nr:Protein-glutamate methylesterase/protein-glutamine glutaminase [Anaerolineae bacterium]
MIRVLVVDDSPTTREAITAILHSEPGIQVIGEAADGLQGVELAAQLKPDVITMDINMPGMNGHDATKAIMAKTPTPIVVVTTITRQEMIRDGLDILLAGALEIVQKPSSMTEQGFDAVRTELIMKVQAIAQIKFPPPVVTPLTNNP